MMVNRKVAAGAYRVGGSGLPLNSTLSSPRRPWADSRYRPFADGVDAAPNGIKRAKMVVVESAIWKGAVRGQVYHRSLVCHARRA